MIGPVSEVGKTMLSSLQGAMSKGMPVDQAITYVKSMAQQGVAPLVDLYALLKQFERMKQPPAEPPMGGNLKDQLNNLQASIVQSPQGQGLGGIQPRTALPPEAQGLASLDAGAMENPAFAGGGIVAFAQGGESDTKKPITPELYTLPKTREELAREAMRKRLELETPEGKAKFEAERDAEMKARGLGKYAKSLEMRDKLAEEAERRAGLLGDEEAALDEEAFWADVAATDQPDFVSALAKSKPKAVERKRATRERTQAAKEKAAEEKVLRQEAREALDRGDMEEYKTKLEAAKTLADTSVKEYVTAQEAERTAEAQRSNAREVARIQQGEGTPLRRAQEALANTPMELENGEPNPAYGAALKRVRDLERPSAASSRRTDLPFLTKVYEKAEAALKTAEQAHATYGNKNTEAALAQARAARDRAYQEFRAVSLGEDFTPSMSGGMSGDFSQMSNEQILQLLGQ